MRKYGFILAILIASGIIAIAHAVVYEALMTILSLTLPGPLSPGASAAILWIFVFLAVSFIIGTFTSMRFNNSLSRAFYIFAATWTGFAIYLFFAAFIYGVLTIVLTFSAASNAGAAVTTAYVGLVLMIIAILTALYGIFNANHLRVTKISVPIRGLPESWKNRKAVWVSDVHLGQVRGAHFSHKVVDAILSQSPDIVFIGGDLYDGVKVNMATVVEPFRKLTGDVEGKRRVPLGVYFIMGNHEEFHETDTLKYAAAIRNIGVNILDDEIVHVEGMAIVGVDHGHTDDKKRFAEILGKVMPAHASAMSGSSAVPTILLKHEPRDLDVAARAGVSFQISGHTHRGQIFPVSLLTRFIFKGFDYGLKEFRGENSKNMQVYTSSGSGTWGLPLRVGTKSEIVLIHFENKI